jgi:polyhydroxybutyrate depolymerase
VFERRNLAGILVGGVAVALAVFAASAPSDGATQPALSRGFKSGGKLRSYLLYVPKSVAPSPALVLVLHGRNGNGAGIRRRTRASFDKLADGEGFLVAYPESLHGAWNTGHQYVRSTADDVGFLAALIDQLIAEYKVDPQRVYVTGFSNGAGMAYWLACARSDKIAALAPVSGGLAKIQMQPCAESSKRPIPLLVIHGTADPINPFGDGELEGNVEYWIRRNGCTLTPQTTYLPQQNPAGSRTHIVSYGGCAGGADVKLYALEGCGHHWPGGDEPLRFGNAGPMCETFDGAEVIWKFFTSTPTRAPAAASAPARDDRSAESPGRTHIDSGTPSP